MAMYAIVYFDGIMFKSRKDSQIINKCVYSVLGIDMNGQKDILGIWISENEGASFYANICSDLKKRGVTDIFIACHDNLKGLGEAINAVFPKTKQQLCIVHQIRNSTKFVQYKDRTEICADLKIIYGEVNLDDAEYAKEVFREKWDKKYPSIMRFWDVESLTEKFYDANDVIDDDPKIKNDKDKSPDIEEDNLFITMQINDYIRNVRPALSWDKPSNQWLIGWKFASLLDSIYMRLFLDLQGGRHWRRCKRDGCHKVFLAINPVAEYCSNVCSNTQNKINSRNRQWTEELIQSYPGIDSEWLKGEAEALLSKPGVGKKKLLALMDEKIKQVARTSCPNIGD